MNELRAESIKGQFRRQIRTSSDPRTAEIPINDQNGLYDSRVLNFPVGSIIRYLPERLYCLWLAVETGAEGTPCTIVAMEWLLRTPSAHSNFASVQIFELVLG